MVTEKHQRFIDALKSSYDECVGLLDPTVPWDPAEFRTHCEAEHLKALMELMDDHSLQVDGKLIEIGTIWVALREYYSSGRLSIQRVSGQILPIDLSYSLTLVECTKSLQPKGKEQGITETEAQPRSPVPLDSLFQNRRLRDGSKGRPERILIRGRPGVGKSTLCKRIVYEYGQRETLREMFEWVLWVPLRKLELVKDLKEFFYLEYFQLMPRGRELAQTLYERILGLDKAETLLILDGWDETYGWPPSKRELVTQLASHSHVIITSRSNGWYAESEVSIDLELEVLGFSEETILNYLANQEIVPSKTTADEIKMFMKNNKSVLELIQLPIHLDALCYSWDELKRKSRSDGVPTATMLYQTIVTKLWRKDILSLEKHDAIDGSILTQEIINAVRDPRRLERVVQREINFLGGLAIDLIEKNRTEFGGGDIDEFIQKLELDGTQLPLSLERNLKKLSFLYSDDRGSQRSYNFIHLTFQEYFAACWLTQDSSQLNRYIRQSKYNPRFATVWRFVAGLLQANGDEKQLCRFFNTIEEEPRDLFGPVHQRLVMHCLNEVVASEENPDVTIVQRHLEVQPSDFAKLRRSLEVQLKQWLLFEYKLEGDSRLAAEREFPEQILEAVLQNESEDVKLKVLVSLRARPKISPRIMELVASWLGGTVPVTLKCAAVNVFWRHEDLSEGILKDIVALLKDPDRDVNFAAADALNRQLVLPECVLKDMAALLKDPDQYIKRKAAEALSLRSDLPEWFLKDIAVLLKDPDKDVKRTAARALSRQSVLPEGALEDMAALLKDLDEDVRSNTADALSRRSDLPEWVLKDMTALLKDIELYVKCIAAEVLSRRSDLPEWVLKDIAALLKDPDRGVKHTAAEALNRQPELPEEAVEDMVGLLKDPESYVKCIATETLSHRSDLPEWVIKDMGVLLKDPDRDVKRTAAAALSRQLDLPEWILKDIAALLKDLDQHVKRTAAEALSRRSDLPKWVLNNIVALLKDPDMDVKRTAAEALSRRSDLPEWVLKDIAALLKDPDQCIKRSAAKASSRQSVLREGSLKDMETLLKDPEPHNRWVAAEALRRYSALSDKDFSFILLNIDRESFNNLYDIWLRISFEEHLSWHNEDNNISYINMPEESRKVPFKQIRRTVQEAQASSGIPLPGVFNRSPLSFVISAFWKIALTKRHGRL